MQNQHINGANALTRLPGAASGVLTFPKPPATRFYSSSPKNKNNEQKKKEKKRAFTRTLDCVSCSSFLLSSRFRQEQNE